MATLREELLDIIIYERFEKEIEMVKGFIYDGFDKKINEIDSAVHLLPYKESSNYTENTEIAKRELFEQNTKLSRMPSSAWKNPLDVEFESLVDNRVLDISYKERVSSHVKLIEYLKGKDEVNGVDVKTSDIYKSGGFIDYKDCIANIRGEEYIVSKEQAKQLLNTSPILKNIMKLIPDTPPSTDKQHDTDTNKEVDAVSEALDKAEKVFNVVFNVSEHKNKSASELVEEIAKAMRTKGMF